MSLGHNVSHSSTETNSSSVMTQVNIDVRIQPEVLYFTIAQPRQLLFLLNKHQHPVHFEFKATRVTKQKYSISCPKGMLKVNEEKTIYIFHKDAISLNSKVDFWKVAIKQALGDNALKPAKCERTVYGKLLNEGQVKQVPSHVPPPPACQQGKKAPPPLRTLHSDSYFHKDRLVKVWGKRTTSEEASQIQEKSTSRSLQDSEPSYSGWRFLASLCVFLWSLYVLSHPVGSTLHLLTLVVTTTMRICAAYCAGLTGWDLLQWWQHHQRDEQKHDAQPGNKPTTGSPYSEERKMDHAGGALLTHTVFVVVAMCLLWWTEGDLHWTSPARGAVRLHIAALAGVESWGIGQILWQAMNERHNQFHL